MVLEMDFKEIMKFYQVTVIGYYEIKNNVLLAGVINWIMLLISYWQGLDCDDSVASFWKLKAPLNTAVLNMNRHKHDLNTNCTLITYDFARQTGQYLAKTKDLKFKRLQNSFN